jgi:hypothetical protein
MKQEIKGTGLGLRREFIDELNSIVPHPVDFLEVAPENWLGVGGRRGKKLKQYAEKYPIVAHGLSLSLGSPSPLDEEFLDNIKQFLSEYNVPVYSEHLSYCSDTKGHLYDLLPMPFTYDAASYVANRIRKVQERLERRIAIENVSYYATPGKKIGELEFLLTVLAEADCDLLLDVNNVYVNSINHGYDAKAFLRSIPKKRISYIHVAGHQQIGENLIVDTHGADVIDPVWELLEYTYKLFGPIPTLLERDNDVPPLKTLLQETKIIQQLQAKVVEPECVLNI